METQPGTPAQKGDGGFVADSPLEEGGFEPLVPLTLEGSKATV
jgi:hypothetical protein